MKEDLAGGKLASDDFGENAACWWMRIPALKLNAIIYVTGNGKVMDKETYEGYTFQADQGSCKDSKEIKPDMDKSIRATSIL